jgi:hypothetical protein
MSSIVSGCCNAFLEYVDCNCICTKCGKSTILIKDGDSLTTSIVYNVITSGNGNNSSAGSNAVNMSNDLLLERLHKFKRNAHDITCALTLVKCPLCNNLCRMSRNQAAQKIFVCTNDKCRHTFTY